MSQAHKDRTTLTLAHKPIQAKIRSKPATKPKIDMLRSAYPHFEKRLRERKPVVLKEIRDTLLRVDSERYSNIAGQIRDAEDQATIELLADISHAEVERDLEELRDIDAALRRIDADTYGICVGCTAPIAHERLEAYPTAKRCLPCQQLHERDRV